MLADQGVLFREAFCAAPTCSGSRASLLTGHYCHNNGMVGLAHRGLALNDYGAALVHTLHQAGYHSILIGEQHISKDPAVIGYDELVKVGSSTASTTVAPLAIDVAARRRRRRAVLPVGRLLRDPPRVLGADLGPRHALLAAARQPARHSRRRAGTWPRSRPARARSTRAIGAVLNALDDLGLADEHPGHLHHRPRHRLPRREGDPDRPRHRRDADHARARRLHAAAR